MALVLIVDDEPDIASLLEFHIQQAGFQSVTALTGEQALTLAQNPVPAAVVLDLMLPDISGKEVCRRLRAASATRLVPILILTARGDELDRLEGFEAGADDYVTKPFSPRELVLRLKALLRRGRAVAEQRLQVGPLSLDKASYRAWLSGELLDLTPLEFKLLHELMKRPGRVVSRERLLLDVWGITTPSETRTVDTHMKRLREKLGRERDCVETVRGVGYRLRPGGADE